MFVILSRLKKKGKYSLVFFLWICYDSYEKKDKTFKTKVREPMQMDLTRGGITRPMLLFAGPMIAGNLLQQCYNIADTLIVGRALGASALASVGFSFTLMTFLTSVLLGLCMGSGALWSMLYGAEREEELKRCIFASFVFIGAVAVLLNVGVLALLEPVMTLLRIPAGAWDETRAYLRVVLLGVCFTFLYNYFACLLRLSGRVHRPQHRAGSLVCPGPGLGGGRGRGGHGARPGGVRRRYRPLRLAAGAPAPAGAAAL